LYPLRYDQGQYLEVVLALNGQGRAPSFELFRSSCYYLFLIDAICNPFDSSTD
jgi:hypothetical protein